MHNHDDKYPSRPGFEPGTPRLPSPVDTNEPSRPASAVQRIQYHTHTSTIRCVGIESDYKSETLWTCTPDAALAGVGICQLLPYGMYRPYC